MLKNKKKIVDYFKRMDNFKNSGFNGAMNNFSNRNRYSSTRTSSPTISNNVARNTSLNKTIKSIGQASGDNSGEIQKALVKKSSNVSSTTPSTTPSAEPSIKNISSLANSAKNKTSKNNKGVVDKIKNYTKEISVGNIIIGLILIYLLVNIAYITSETYRVGSTIIELNKYSFTSIIDYRYLYQEGRQNKPLKNFHIATSFRPYLAKNQLFDYASERIVKQTIKCGPRCMVVDIFNDTLSDDAFPIVSSGFEKGNWKLTLSSLSFDKFCNALSQTIFTSGYVNNYEDPFILILNLKTNGNYKCHGRIQETLYKYFKSRLLPSKFSYGKADLPNTPIKELMGKIIIMTSVSVKNEKLNEITNFTLDREEFHKISFKSLVDEVSVSDNIKLNMDDVRVQMREHLALVVPEENSFFTRNYNPQNFLDTGCQFIAMNYQKVDKYMEQYITHFKNSSFVEKKPGLQGL